MEDVPRVDRVRDWLCLTVELLVTACELIEAASFPAKSWIALGYRGRSWKMCQGWRG